MSVCNSSLLSGVLGVFKSLLSIIQLFGPLLLIVSLIYTFIKLMQNPDDKKLISRIKNSFLALVVVFFVPLFVTMTLNLVDESSSFGACWKNAGNGGFGSPNYIEMDSDKDRVNIVGGSEYEKGEENSNKDNSNNSNNDIKENENVISNSSTNTSKIIFIGDSRTVQMYSYLASTWNNNTYSKAGVIQYDNNLFVAQGSMGLDWMKNTGVPAAKKYFSNGVSIVILMGVNDLYNQDKYIEYLNSNVDSWLSSGSKIYFVTVNPCDGSYSHMNSKIKTFNSKLKSKISKKIGWINTHDNLTFKTTDGLHYDKNTSIKIYNYIKNKV